MTYNGIVRFALFVVVILAALVAAACSERQSSTFAVPLDRGSSSMPAAPVEVSSTPKLFVANAAANKITEYPFTASGDATPRPIIKGANTGLNAPSAIGLDSLRQLYVLNSASVTIFVAGAHGNATPKFTISGGATQLTSPQGMAVDSAGDVYVSNNGSSGGYITVYIPVTTFSWKLSRTIFDGSSSLFVPAGIALHGNLLYVADKGDQSINEYTAAANGIVNPVAVISGLSSPTGVAVDSKGLIYVTDVDSIVVYAANANGHATPLRTIAGSATHLSGPAGLIVRYSVIAVANANANSINLYPQSGNGNISPTRQIVGPDTGLSAPAGIWLR